MCGGRGGGDGGGELIGTASGDIPSSGARVLCNLRCVESMVIDEEMG